MTQRTVRTMAPTLLGLFASTLLATALVAQTPRKPNPKIPRIPEAEEKTYGPGTQLRYAVTLTRSESTAGAETTGAETAPAPRTTKFDCHYLVYGEIPSTGTFEVALRATQRGKDDTPFIHPQKSKKDAPKPAGEDRVIYLSLDEENRLGSAFGFWKRPEFGYLTFSPVQPKGLEAGEKTVAGELLDLGGEEFSAVIAWEGIKSETGTTYVGRLEQPTVALDRPVRLAEYEVRYEVDDESGRPGAIRLRLVLVQPATGASPAKTETVTIEAKREAYLFLDPNMHFQRRAELATVKGQMMLVHPAADVEERSNFAAMLRDRLIGSPFQTVCMDMFDDYVEATRPRYARYLAQLVTIEDRYGDLLPDFEGRDQLKPMPTLLMVLSGRDRKDNERLLTAVESVRMTYEGRLQVVLLSAEKPGTAKRQGTTEQPTALGRLLREEQPRYPVFTGQTEFVREMGIRETPCVLFIDEEWILNSGMAGFHRQADRLLQEKVQGVTR